MTADLLRRAAAKLREDINRLPEPWRSSPWRVVQSDTESTDAIAACSERHNWPYAEETSAYDCCRSSGEGGVGHEAVAAYIRRVQPEVGELLARWLDAAAEVVEANYAHDGLDLDAIDDTYRGAVTTARAILREEP